MPEYDLLRGLMQCLLPAAAYKKFEDLTSPFDVKLPSIASISAPATPTIPTLPAAYTRYLLCSLHNTRSLQDDTTMLPT